MLKLKKSLYGLKQSGNAWNKLLNRTLVDELGFIRMKTDPCVYKRGSSVSDTVIIAVYVDHILIYSQSDRKISELKSQINCKFSIDDIGECKKVVGMKVDWQNNEIRLSQSELINELLTEYNMNECNGVKSPLEAGERLERCGGGSAQCGQIDGWRYRSSVGKLNFLAATTRPDLMFPLSYLSQYNQCPHSEHMKALKRVVRYLSGTKDKGIVFRKDEPCFEAYSDSDWAGSQDRRSYTGYVVKMSGGCVAWETKKQATVALSSTEAEYMAVTSASKELLHLGNLITELNVREWFEPGLLILKCDNKGAIALTEKVGYSPRSKHIDIRYHFVRDLVERNMIKLEFVSSKENLADLFTKPLGPVIFQNLIKYIVADIDHK